MAIRTWTPPVMMALGARLTVLSPTGERSVALEDFFTGYYETVLGKNELIAEAHIPAQGARRAAYMKVTTGSADDWPALGVAVAIEADGKAIKSARVVVSAATSMAMRLKSAEAALAGKTADDKTLAQAGDAAAEEADFIADVRGSVPYKRELLRRSSRRMLLRRGESGPPCGTPLDVWFSLPSTTTPARRYLPISLRMPLSLTLRATRFIKVSWSTPKAFGA